MTKPALPTSPIPDRTTPAMPSYPPPKYSPFDVRFETYAEWIDTINLSPFSTLLHDIQCEVRNERDRDFLDAYIEYKQNEYNANPPSNDDDEGLSYQDFLDEKYNQVTKPANISPIQVVAETPETLKQEAQQLLRQFKRKSDKIADALLNPLYGKKNTKSHNRLVLKQMKKWNDTYREQINNLMTETSDKINSIIEKIRSQTDDEIAATNKYCKEYKRIRSNLTTRLRKNLFNYQSYNLKLIN